MHLAVVTLSSGSSLHPFIMHYCLLECAVCLHLPVACMSTLNACIALDLAGRVLCVWSFYGWLAGICDREPAPRHLHSNLHVRATSYVCAQCTDHLGTVSNGLATPSLHTASMPACSSHHSLSVAGMYVACISWHQGAMDRLYCNGLSQCVHSMSSACKCFQAELRRYNWTASFAACCWFPNLSCC